MKLEVGTSYKKLVAHKQFNICVYKQRGETCVFYCDCNNVLIKGNEGSMPHDTDIWKTVQPIQAKFCTLVEHNLSCATLPPPLGAIPLGLTPHVWRVSRFAYALASHRSSRLYVSYINLFLVQLQLVQSSYVLLFCSCFVPHSFSCYIFLHSNYSQKAQTEAEM